MDVQTVALHWFREAALEPLWLIVTGGRWSIDRLLVGMCFQDALCLCLVQRCELVSSEPHVLSGAEQTGSTAVTRSPGADLTLGEEVLVYSYLTLFLTPPFSSGILTPQTFCCSSQTTPLNVNDTQLVGFDIIYSVIHKHECYLRVTNQNQSLILVTQTPNDDVSAGVSAAFF